MISNIRCPNCGSKEYYGDGDWDEETGEQTAEYMLCKDCGFSGPMPIEEGD